MSDPERQRAGHEARRDMQAHPEQWGRHEDAMRRYLGSVAYTQEPKHRQEAESRRQPKPAGAGETPAEQPAPPVVVVGADDSASGFAALDQAAAEAGLRGWALRLVRVRVRGETATAPGYRESADLLAAMSARVRARTPMTPVATELCSGSVAQALLDRQATAGLLVVGSRGRGALTGLVGGSTSTHLAARATVPVLVVRVPEPVADLGRPDVGEPGVPEPGVPEPQTAAEGGETSPLPIVVGVDGSAEADAAAVFAAEEARLRSVPLLAIHVTPEVSDYVGGGRPDPLTTGALAPHAGAIAGVAVRRRSVEGDATQMLVDASRHAAAVVVGARGRGGPHGVRIGSTSQALIRRAHCPVFVIHPPAHTGSPARAA